MILISAGTDVGAREYAHGCAFERKESQYTVLQDIDDKTILTFLTLLLPFNMRAAFWSDITIDLIPCY